MQQRQDRFAYLVGIILLLFLLGWLGFALPTSWHRSKQLEKELAILDQQVAELQERNQKLRQEQENFQNQEFVEQQARERFNYQKKGEQAVVFVDRRATASAPETTTSPGFFTRAKNWFEVLFRRD